MIPVQRPMISTEERDAVGRVIESKWLGRGPLSEMFESRLREILGTRHVLAVNTGTSALHLALACLDLHSGDEVLLPSLSFAACPQAVLMAGGTPVLCEVREDTLNLDSEDAIRRVSPRSRAVMPIHFGGFACEMDSIIDLAETAGTRRGRRRRPRVWLDISRSRGRLTGRPRGVQLRPDQEHHMWRGRGRGHGS